MVNKTVSRVEERHLECVWFLLHHEDLWPQVFPVLHLNQCVGHRAAGELICSVKSLIIGKVCSDDPNETRNQNKLMMITMSHRPSQAAFTFTWPNSVDLSASLRILTDS